MINEFELTGKLSEDCTAVNFSFGSSLFRLLSHLRNKELLIYLKPLTYKRTLAQNRWYWGVAIPTIRAWHKDLQGEDPGADAIHAYNLKNICKLEPLFKEVLGEEVLYFDFKSTSKMNTKEFNLFKENLQKYWAEKDCIILDPRNNSLTEDYL